MLFETILNKQVVMISIVKNVKVILGDLSYPFIISNTEIKVDPPSQPDLDNQLGL
jgi:hypothetical protein